MAQGSAVHETPTSKEVFTESECIVAADGCGVGKFVAGVTVAAAAFVLGFG